MQKTKKPVAISKHDIRLGRIISAVPVLFLLFDSVIKLIRIQSVVDSFRELGFPVELAIPIGLLELVCVIIYIIPRSSVLGAILLTGFLGGATAVKVRFEDPWFLFSVGIGVLAWTGIFLKDQRVRDFFSFRKYQGY